MAWAPPYLVWGLPRGQGPQFENPEGYMLVSKETIPHHSPIMQWMSHNFSVHSFLHFQEFSQTQPWQLCVHIIHNNNTFATLLNTLVHITLQMFHSLVLCPLLVVCTSIQGSQSESLSDADQCFLFFFLFLPRLPPAPRVVPLVLALPLEMGLPVLPNSQTGRPMCNNVHSYSLKL